MTTPATGGPPDWWRTVVTVGAAMLGLWFLTRRRQEYPGARDTGWHRCHRLHCDSRELLRPSELLCPTDAQKIPQLLRRSLDVATRADWPRLARRAIDFVTEQLDRERDLEDIMFGDNVPGFDDDLEESLP
jgi:hypothetical protein